jgi:hypothetical protein
MRGRRVVSARGWNQRAPSALRTQPAAHCPPPCSVGYPGRSREWLRPCLFGALPQIMARGPARRGAGMIDLPC